MDQAFSITHTTLAEVGDCDEVCDWVLPDGSYTMGHDADYLGDHGQGAIFLDDQLWFLTIPEHDGHDVWFWFSHDGFGSFEQEGYWDFG